MTSTVRELLKNLKYYTDETVVTIKDVDNVEFAFASSVGAAIVDFILEADGLNIVIDEKVDEEPDEDESES